MTQTDTLDLSEARFRFSSKKHGRQRCALSTEPDAMRLLRTKPLATLSTQISATWNLKV
jgi:hypothetical protein